MASERPREPEGEDSIKLSADVKPFVPKFGGLNVEWSESSEARVFPGCPANYYPFVQESPVTEQKVYPEDMAFGAPAFPRQYVSSEITLHPFACSTYALDSAQSVCSVPALQCDHSQPHCHLGCRTEKPQNEHTCPLPREAKGVFKKRPSDERRTGDEQRSSSRRADGAVPSEMRAARGSYHLSARTESGLKTDGHHRRADRKSRVLTKSVCTSKPEFEFSRLDFPELQSSKTSNVQETQKQPRWGPLGSAARNASLLRDAGKPSAGMVAGEMVKTNHTGGAVTHRAANSSPSCTRAELSWTPMGYIVRQTVSSGSAAATENVSSVITLKKTASSTDPQSAGVAPEAVSSDSSYNRETSVHSATKAKASQGGELEQNETSRKNKKKKEKSKPNYEVLTVQEPPRIEDAEEFPNLSAASERRHRVESPKLQRKQQMQSDFKAGGKKSQTPVQLDLGGMLAALEKQQQVPHAKPSSRPVVFSVGAVPVLSKDASSGERGRRSSQVKTPHNPLDSSAPLMKKGKQREIPKAKKPTSLKKIILKERQERMQLRLQESAVSLAVANGDAQDVESSASDHVPQQVHPTGPEKTEESVSSTPVIEGESEEPTGTEFQKNPAACQPAPGSATFPKIHSRRFRDYCSQMLSKEVDACVTGLLKELVRFQDRMYQKDPVKAKTKRRLVLGLREVLKHLKLRKLKCIIISPNCEKTQSKGGLDDTLHTIIDCACEQNIPFVFALNRKALGRSLNKAVPVSIVGIFSYDGAQDQFHKMVELTMAARQAYKTMLETVRQELAGQPGPQTPPSPPIQDPIQSTEEGTLESTGKEPHYIEIWRKHLEAYSQQALELEDSLEASTSQMMNLNL
ncbi:selenocysteine insertion sequence-binding protein 2 isoform X1 [Cricetulus griseus]|uniref:Selenocysteine insertion sequence-binding protein 2 n=2 Tax=Cricetulus griseus TaxID=10029 RepID=A0A061ICJ0_CRIGR|nr:selenocysteine insertion sequence-binding protein 2 isoform X1 [Cricetulus griseus]XP_027265710.1 selenocysteine insertion sequence-binding protein 2 isoform X1 [Cricetulus griseus]ERE80760.1 selenocysteine insertion sequence-binding protein 2 [Cricetulus griseus]